MTQIKKLKNSQGTQVYPQTHTKAVIDDNGYTAESRLQAMQGEINQAQLEVGAVPSDLTPTEGSSNWVTSGGVFSATNIPTGGGENVDLSSFEPVLGSISAANKWWVAYSPGTQKVRYGYSIFVPVEPGREYIITGRGDISYYAFMINNIVGEVNSTVTTFAFGYTERHSITDSTEKIIAPYDAKYLWMTHSLTETEPDGEWLPSSLTKTAFVSVKETVNSLLERVEVLEPTASVIRVQTSIGYLSAATGLYPTTATYYVGYSHTPRFIKNCGTFKILTIGITGKVYFYGNNQSYLGSDLRQDIDTTNGVQTITPPESAKYFRLAIIGTVKYVDIESNWNEECMQFQARPSDGYQPFTCEVKALRCNSLESTSSLQEQYVVTTDSGMLHLPSSYKENGEPTPLIIFVHGAGSNYTYNSTSFATTNPLAPEWDAAGFAQMDVDLIPDLYNDKQNNSGGGSSDDAECIFAAYKWCIEHFNIRRDGVYLIGRSRGGQAVLSVLGKYNPSVMPIVCAISNAGAHQLINYGLTNGSSSAFWNLICESYCLPTTGRPTPSGNSVLTAQDNIYNFLNTNIDIWWKKGTVALKLLAKNDNEEKTSLEIFQYIHEHPKISGVDNADYLAFLKKMLFRSPVPLRFDWCVGDTTQPWNANNGVGNYSSVIKDGFVNNQSGNSEYREWPTVDTTTPSISGATDRGHWHELYNLYNGDYTLPNGAVITNPSMARVEWLLWCMSHDNRF